MSHHVQLCAPQAAYIVSHTAHAPKIMSKTIQVTLEKGKLLYQGNSENFMSSSVLESLIQTRHSNLDASQEHATGTLIEDVEEEKEKEKARLTGTEDPTSQAVNGTSSPPKAAKTPKKLIEDEARAVGRIGRSVWLEYVRATGGSLYWGLFLVALVTASLAPVAENGWIK